MTSNRGARGPVGRRDVRAEVELGTRRVAEPQRHLGQPRSVHEERPVADPPDSLKDGARQRRFEPDDELRERAGRLEAEDRADPRAALSI